VLAYLAVAFWPTALAVDDSVTARPLDAQPMVVLDVLSGDTVVLGVDKPGSQVQEFGQITARLLGINSPNFGLIDECYAVEAEGRLSALLPDGELAWVVKDEVAKDELGRWLMYVWTHDGRFVNYELTVDGFVVAEQMPPNDKYWDIIAAGQTRAVARLWGLWGECGR
jgi:micrococcal nuclease